jgi:prevent-host-death family protein
VIKVAIDEAVARLEELIEKAGQGHEVVIVHRNGTAVRVVTVPVLGTPRYGSARGMFSFTGDFKRPAEDLSSGV